MSSCSVRSSCSSSTSDSAPGGARSTISITSSASTGSSAAAGAADAASRMAASSRFIPKAYQVLLNLKRVFKNNQIHSAGGDTQASSCTYGRSTALGPDVAVATCEPAAP